MVLHNVGKSFFFTSLFFQKSQKLFFFYGFHIKLAETVKAYPVKTINHSYRLTSFTLSIQANASLGTFSMYTVNSSAVHSE